MKAAPRALKKAVLMADLKGDCLVEMKAVLMVSNLVHQMASDWVTMLVHQKAVPWAVQRAAHLGETSAQHLVAL